MKVDYLFVGGNTKPNVITAPTHFKRSCTMSKCFIPIIYPTFYFSVCLFVCVKRSVFMKRMKRKRTVGIKNRSQGKNKLSIVMYLSVKMPNNLGTGIIGCFV